MATGSTHVLEPWRKGGSGMIRYIVTALFVNIMSGTLELTDEQYMSRAHALKPVKGMDDQYEVTGRVQFKRGEEIGYDGEVNKSLVKSLQPVEEAPEEDKTQLFEDPVNLKKLTKAELVEIAGSLGIEDPDKLVKDELIQAITELESPE